MVGIKDNDEIVVEVSYRKDEAEQVDELEDILEELKEREYEEEQN